MMGVSSWDDVDRLFTFNFDLELKLIFSQGPQYELEQIPVGI